MELENRPGVYRIVHAVSNRTYIGSSIKMRTRLKTHRAELCRNKHRNIRLQRACIRDGIDAFIFEPLLNCQVEELCFLEQKFIDAYIDHDLPIYNQKPSSDSRHGFKQIHSLETRAKMSASGKGKRKTPEHIAKCAAAQKGKHVSLETRAKLRAANLGKHLTLETKAKIGAKSKGRILTFEERTKRSISQKGRQYCLGRVLSQDTRTKISMALKRYCAAGNRPSLSTEHRENISVGLLAYQKQKLLTLQGKTFQVSISTPGEKAVGAYRGDR